MVHYTEVDFIAFSSCSFFSRSSVTRIPAFCPLCFVGCVDVFSKACTSHPGRCDWVRGFEVHSTLVGFRFHFFPFLVPFFSLF